MIMAIPPVPMIRRAPTQLVPELWGSLYRHWFARVNFNKAGGGGPFDECGNRGLHRQWRASVTRQMKPGRPIG
jgi:hypothetical protein